MDSDETLPSSDTNHTLEFGDYSIVKDDFNRIGRGGFGSVYHGKVKSTGEKIAAKQVGGFYAREKQEGELKAFEKRLDHPNIVRILFAGPEPDKESPVDLWVIMELCHGDLENFLETENPDFGQILILMKDSASGLNFLHNNKIIHRDLKPGNILIKKENGRNVAKLTDFGVSKFLQSSGPEGRFTTRAGTEAFKAPEYFAGYVKQEVILTKAVDIYSQGLVFLYMCLTKEARKKFGVEIICEYFFISLLTE